MKLEMDQALETKRAGQVILSQLRLFNEAAVFFENVINPAFMKGIDDCTKEFIADNAWLGKASLNDATVSWLAPVEWCVNPGEKKPEVRASFCFDSVDDDDEHWMPLFCDVASKGGRAGLAFYVESRYFGGDRAWKNKLGKVPEEVLQQLARLGFQKQGNGSFFLPVTLDVEQLLQSWTNDESDDVFASDNDCFVPLHEALEILQQAVPVFSTLMTSCLEEGGERSEVLA